MTTSVLTKISLRKSTIFLGMVLALSGCGTTTGIMSLQPDQEEVNLQKYSNVIVYDFVDKTNKTLKDYEKNETYHRQVESAGEEFADKLVRELKILNQFDSVTRNGVPDENSILINGFITKFAEGNAAARLLVGFGAGSTYFDVDTDIRDYNKELIGTLRTDKNSWILGGGIAATQTVDTFMIGAAKKIATEISEAKNPDLKNNDK